MPGSWLGPGRVAALGTALWASACVLSDVDLEGRACPCTDGYSCDEATNTCVKGDGTTSSTSVATTTVASTGEGPTTTTVSSSASVTSAGGGGTGGEGGEGGEGGSTTGVTISSTGTGGEGGEGGAGGGGCAPGQTTAVPYCDDFSDGFDDSVAFFDTWSFTGSQSSFVVDGSQLTITMTAASPLVAYGPSIFDMVSCGMTARLVTAPEAANIYGRLSFGPSGATTRFSIGVVAGTLQARDGDTVVAAVDYDPGSVVYLRLREEGGTLYYDTSVDGICWDELQDIPTTETLAVTGRIGLVSDAAAAPSMMVFDSFNVVP